MPLTRALGGFALTTQLQTLTTNPADSGEIRTVEVRFANITAAPGSSHDVTQCLRIDASTSPATARPAAANNTTVRARETIKVRIMLMPGDSIQISGSAPNTIYASGEQTFAEPVA